MRHLSARSGVRLPVDRRLGARLVAGLRDEHEDAVLDTDRLDSRASSSV